MMCEGCGNKAATVHWTEMVNGAVTKLHLCEACAAAKGLDVNNPGAFSDVLLGVVGKKPESAPPAQDAACAACHMRLSDFKKTTRLGCPACYERFSAELAPLLSAMHKGTRHMGKVPAACREQRRAAESLAALRQAMEAAVAAEQYEEAARLRDQIQLFLEGESPPRGPVPEPS